MTKRLATAAEGVSKFSDIEVPDALRSTLKTGWDHVDVLFTGSGIRPSTCALVTGLPGSGKTTFNLQLADKLAGIGHAVLYNSCEESAEQLRMTAERLGLKQLLANGFHSCESEIGAVLNLADNVRNGFKGLNLGNTTNPEKNRGMFLFIDSLQTLERAREKAGPGRNMTQNNQATAAMWDIAAWCKSTMAVCSVIGQVTKDGTFAGKQEVKHAIDCHMELLIDMDRKSETYQQRTAELSKNRFGSSGTYFPYNIGAKGISFDV